jgi:hypothetical protein
MAHHIRASTAIAAAVALIALTGCANADTATDSTASDVSAETTGGDSTDITAADTDEELDYYGRPTTLPDEWVFGLTGRNDDDTAMLSFNASTGVVQMVPYNFGEYYGEFTLSADHRHVVALDESELYANVTNLVNGEGITLELDTVTGTTDFEPDVVLFHRSDPNLLVVVGWDDTIRLVDIRTPDKLGELITMDPFTDQSIDETDLPDRPDSDHGTTIQLADGTVWNFGMTFNVNGDDVVFRASSLAPGATEWEVGERITMPGFGEAFGADGDDLEDRNEWWVSAPATGADS